MSHLGPVCGVSAGSAGNGGEKKSVLRQKRGLEKHNGWPVRYTGQKWAWPAGRSVTTMRRGGGAGPDIQSSSGGTVARNGHKANTMGTFHTRCVPLETLIRDRRRHSALPPAAAATVSVFSVCVCVCISAPSRGGDKAVNTQLFISNCRLRDRGWLGARRWG